MTDLVDRTNLHGACVRLQTFRSRERGDYRRELLQRRWRELLDRDHFHKIRSRQAATQSRSAARRQNMARASGVVSSGFRRIWPQEHCTCTFDFRKQRRIVQA